MLTKCVVLNGEIINIGEWDYKIERVPIEEGSEELVEVITNPLPEGAETVEIEVIQNTEGKYLITNSDTAYYYLRQAEYPPITDQLDAFWKGGSALEEMRAEIMEVKAKYPKE